MVFAAIAEVGNATLARAEKRKEVVAPSMKSDNRLAA
jgi:hypothetical protein